MQQDQVGGRHGRAATLLQPPDEGRYLTEREALHRPRIHGEAVDVGFVKSQAFVAGGVRAGGIEQDARTFPARAKDPAARAVAENDRRQGLTFTDVMQPHETATRLRLHDRDGADARFDELHTQVQEPHSAGTARTNNVDRSHGQVQAGVGDQTYSKPWHDPRRCAGGRDDGVDLLGVDARPPTCVHGASGRIRCRRQPPSRVAESLAAALRVAQ